MADPKIYDFKQFPVAHEVDGGEREYTVEFDLESLMNAVDVLTDGGERGLLDTATEIFFWGLRKNHPFVTKAKARKFVEAVARDEEYTLNAFSDIIDEYTRLQTIFLQGSGSKKATKRFVALEPKVAVAPGK